MALDLGKWRRLFETVPMLGVAGFTLTDYLGRSDTSLTDEKLFLGSLAKPLSVTSAVSRVPIGLGNNGAAGRYIVFLSAAGEVRVNKQNDAGTTGAALSGVFAAANEWILCGRLFDTDTSRYASANGVIGAQDVTSIADPTIDFQNIGVSQRAAVGLAFEGTIGPSFILNSLPTAIELQAVGPGRQHPALVFDPDSFLRAWFPYPGFPMGFDFSTAAAHMTVTGTALRFAPGPPISLHPRRRAYRPKFTFNQTLSTSGAGTASLTAIKVILATLTATAGSAVSLVKRFGKVLAASGAGSAALAKMFALTRAATASATGALTKRIAKTLGAAAANLVALVAQFISGALKPAKVTVTDAPVTTVAGNDVAVIAVAASDAAVITVTLADSAAA